MGFLDAFRSKPDAAPEPLLPLPRATRTWPKAQPAAPKAAVPAVSSLSAPPTPPGSRPAPAVPTPKPPTAVVRPPAPKPAVAVAPPPPAPVRPKSDHASLQRPAPAAKADDTSLQRMAPAARKEATQVASAFARWKQTVAPYSAPLPAAARDESSVVVRPAPAAEPPRQQDPVLYAVRAAAKAARGDHEGAIVDYGIAIEIDPKCVTAYAARAASLEALGRTEDAKKDYAKSIEIELRREIARLARPLGS
jgi:hypothetical protein